MMKKYDADSLCLYKITDCETSGLDKCLKNFASENRLTVNMLKDPKHCCEVCTAPLLSYFLITLREIELENVSLGVI